MYSEIPYGTFQFDVSIPHISIESESLFFLWSTRFKKKTQSFRIKVNLEHVASMPNRKLYPSKFMLYLRQSR